MAFDIGPAHLYSVLLVAWQKSLCLSKREEDDEFLESAWKFAQLSAGSRIFHLLAYCTYGTIFFKLEKFGCSADAESIESEVIGGGFHNQISRICSIFISFLKAH